MQEQFAHTKTNSSDNESVLTVTAPTKTAGKALLMIDGDSFYNTRL
jgi:hypothetical protein